MEIQNKVVLLTGASGGIGSAIARHFSSLGASLALTSRDDRTLSGLAKLLPNSLTIAADLTSEADRQRCVDTALRHFGHIDILINCAAVALAGPVETIDTTFYRKTLELNLVAPLHMMQLVIPHMKTHGAGTIINISSQASLKNTPLISGYASTKHALNNLTLAARQELAKDNITVSLFRPGLVETAFGQHSPAPEPEHFRHAPDGSMRSHVLMPETVAKKVADLIKSGDAILDLIEGQ